MVLARKLDWGGDTMSSIASGVRELRVTLGAALASGVQAADPIDELGRRREERLKRAGSG